MTGQATPCLNYQSPRSSSTCRHPPSYSQIQLLPPVIHTLSPGSRLYTRQSVWFGGSYRYQGFPTTGIFVATLLSIHHSGNLMPPDVQRERSRSRPRPSISDKPFLEDSAILLLPSRYQQFRPLTSFTIVCCSSSQQAGVFPALCVPNTTLNTIDAVQYPRPTAISRTASRGEVRQSGH